MSKFYDFLCHAALAAMMLVIAVWFLWYVVAPFGAAIASGVFGGK